MARRRRSLHFVPGGNDRMLTRALTLPADGLILDLEDAVAPDRKAATRGVVGEWLGRDFGGRERWVRMNPLATGHGQADLEATIAARPDGYVVPKPGSAADVREIVRILDRLEQKHGIPNGATRLTLIATETPEGLLNIREIATATPRTVAISWGIEDLGAVGDPRGELQQGVTEGAALARGDRQHRRDLEAPASTHGQLEHDLRATLERADADAKIAAAAAKIFARTRDEETRRFAWRVYRA